MPTVATSPTRSDGLGRYCDLPRYLHQRTLPNPQRLMFTKEDHEFVDFLFDKLTCLTDVEMIDLHDDDSCCDHIELQRCAEDFEMTVDEMLHADL